MMISNMGSLPTLEEEWVNGWLLLLEEMVIVVRTDIVVILVDGIIWSNT
jgi:hypothetical protein